MEWETPPLPPSNDYAGREAIMMSYQELTAGGESSSPLFQGCRRAKEVISLQLDGAAQPGEEFG